MLVGLDAFQKVVQDIPLIGNGVPAEANSSARSRGDVNARPLGSTPPATTLPSISGGGKVSGTLVMTVVTPAAVRSGRIVRSLIDRYVTGSCFWLSKVRSKMSYTPWFDGSRPVRNDGHADQEWLGTVDFSTPRAPRSMRDRRLGRIPASSMGSRMRQSAPSQPISSTRDISLPREPAAPDGAGPHVV